MLTNLLQRPYNHNSYFITILWTLKDEYHVLSLTLINPLNNISLQPLWLAGFFDELTYFVFNTMENEYMQSLDTCCCHIVSIFWIIEYFQVFFFFFVSNTHFYILDILNDNWMGIRTQAHTIHNTHKSIIHGINTYAYIYYDEYTRVSILFNNNFIGFLSKFEYCDNTRNKKKPLCAEI